MDVTFGAMAPPLHEQTGLGRGGMEPHQADADAVTRLIVRGLMTEGEGHRARLR